MGGDDTVRKGEMRKKQKKGGKPEEKTERKYKMSADIYGIHISTMYNNTDHPTRRKASH